MGQFGIKRNSDSNGLKLLTLRKKLLVSKSTNSSILNDNKEKDLGITLPFRRNKNCDSELLHR
jgi:hypothetical protein